MEVQVKSGHQYSELSDADVAICRARIAEIAEASEDGIATPEAIIEDARDPDSPLHPYYIWDPEEAFGQYLLDRTRSIVKAIRYEVHYNQQVVSVRAFESVVTPSGERGYKSIEVAKGDEYYKRQMVEGALQSLKQFETKYAALMEFFGLGARVNTIRAKIEAGRKAWEETQ